MVLILIADVNHHSNQTISQMIQQNELIIMSKPVKSMMANKVEFFSINVKQEIPFRDSLFNYVKKNPKFAARFSTICKEGAINVLKLLLTTEKLNVDLLRPLVGLAPHRKIPNVSAVYRNVRTGRDVITCPYDQNSQLLLPAIKFFETWGKAAVIAVFRCHFENNEM